MDFPRLSSLKITLVAGLALLTTDALFAQSADQSGVDSLKTQMNQMQRQYEQRIEAMEAKMKTLESNANSGSILNTRVLTDAEGKGVAPAPMLDESFLKSLTRNFTFSVYVRAGVGFNGNGGPQDFSFIVPENVGGRWRLGNENDAYMELTWKQAHMLGDSPDVMDVSMTFTPAISYSNSKTTSINQFGEGVNWAMRQAYLEAKNFIKSAPEITVWGGQRFYDRHDIHIHDYFFDDYSGYGLGFDNIDLGVGKLLVSYLGGIRDDFNNSNTNTTGTQINDPRRGGFYMHTLDARIHDIDLFGGKLELIGDYHFFKGGTYAISGGHPDLVIGDASGFRVGAIYQHAFGGYTPPPAPPPSLSKEGKPIAAPPPPPPGPTIAPSFWQIAAFYGYGPGEMMGTDPNGGQSGNTGNGVGSGGTPFAGYNFNINRGLIHTFPNGTQFVNSSVAHATRIRANAQVVWNFTDWFSLGATAYWEYDDQGFLSAEPTVIVAGTQHFRTTGGSRNTVGAGIRPVFWVNDWFAIQGQAGWEYTSNDRSSSISTFQPGGPGNITVPTNDTFGRSGNMGIFTICPTIKPKGGFFTRPEFRAFATYAIWSRSLEGSIGTTQYQNNREGWVFGVQSEWFF